MFLCLTYYLLLMRAQILWKHVLTCRFLSGINANNFCPVEKIISKVTALLSYRIWTSFVRNLVILFQRFLQYHKYSVPQTLRTHFTILLVFSWMSKINIWHVFAYICPRIMLFNFLKMILWQQSHEEFPKPEQGSITGQGLYLKCATRMQSLHSTPGEGRY